jgi:hypothetical protein
MEGLWEAAAICGFMDLGFIGLPYTYDNHQNGDRNVKVRFDRGLDNAPFLNLFWEARVWHVQNAMFDHSCQVVQCLDHNSY